MLQTTSPFVGVVKSELQNASKKLYTKNLYQYFYYVSFTHVVAAALYVNKGVDKHPDEPNMPIELVLLLTLKKRTSR